MKLNETKLHNIVGENIVSANLNDDSPLAQTFDFDISPMMRINFMGNNNGGFNNNGMNNDNNYNGNQLFDNAKVSFDLNASLYVLSIHYLIYQSIVFHSELNLNCLFHLELTYVMKNKPFLLSLLVLSIFQFLFL